MNLDRDLVLYAVVIGKKDKDWRYVAFNPILKHLYGALAVCENLQDARKMRKKIIEIVGHNHVHVIKFVPSSKGK